MAIYIGNTEIKKPYIGGTEVKKVYVGNNQVWPPEDAPYSLSGIFKNNLISDYQNNLLRNNNITITAHNSASKYIEIDATAYIESLELTAPFSWMICQGTEASILTDVVSVQKI
ncbi:hypothetical protein HX109_15355 [Galbibacter sp. BG1]|uniref:hypothetical protein n=1 Tax=Galbibacter sp. BG1 TaxID=1170699 RepID=UPI0015B86F36|nr:hypothetical protein [Galbibacter sp. BG1]QLE02876.1 hypothetical protein HX109_15355 [Galbibacter sp. BG1]